MRNYLEIGGLLDEARRLRKSKKANASSIDPHSYAYRPLDYVREVLGYEHVTEDQKAILKAIHEPPFRVSVCAGHGVGKSCLGGWLINYWHDSFVPSVVISTGPDARSVRDVLWNEVRMQRQGARMHLGGLMPAAPEIRGSAPNHYAKGFTANRGEGFHGRHDRFMLFVIDECVAVDATFFEVFSTMFKPEMGHAWITFCNPTDTTSQAYVETHAISPDGSPRWKTFSLDCLQHPNIDLQLRGEDPIIPAAVSLSQVDDWVTTWCQPIPEGEHTAADLQWREKWYRQGPVFEARVRGRWPTSDSGAVWSDSLWAMCEGAAPDRKPLSELPEIGIDVARKGEDFTTFHVRWGPASYYHESQQGWRTTATVDRAKELARIWAAEATKARDRNAEPVKPEQIAIKVDDDGVGGGVVDQLMQAGYKVAGVGAGTRSLSGRYDRMRSELWFQVAERARVGEVQLGLLPKETLVRLRQQAMISGWSINGAGQRVVWSKDVIKELIKRSPDDMDALNLAYLQEMRFEAPSSVEDPERRKVWSKDDRHEPRRRIFGG